MFVFIWHNKHKLRFISSIISIVTNNQIVRVNTMFRAVHVIPCENPYNKLWDSFLFFENEPASKSFLQFIYEKNYPGKEKIFAFQNTAKFIYNIKQARQYYSAALQSEILIRPLLLYYGMVSLMKAFILTQDPHYPSTTRVLQHGLTSRKIKKNEYFVGDDEIKIQKEGLLPFVHSFLSKDPLQNRYKVHELFSLLPELNGAYQKVYQNKQHLIPVNLSNFRDPLQPSTLFYLPESVLDATHRSYNSFIDYLNRHNTGQGRFSPSHLETPAGIIRLEWNNPSKFHVSENGDGFENHLFLFDYKGNFYFRFEAAPVLPEITIHFMIMYILGMLCRYETERWGEIIFSFSSEDMYMIHEFLTLSSRKFPNLIYDVLLGERHIFQTS